MKYEVHVAMGKDKPYARGKTYRTLKLAERARDKAMGKGWRIVIIKEIGCDKSNEPGRGKENI